MPVQLPLDEQTYVQGVPSCQVPVKSHVCGVIPEHFLVVGTHDPVQFPAPVQTNGQVIESCQLPMPSQVCCWVELLHCLAPGVHEPVQLPVAQTNMQT